ncbi:MAG: LacI family DNA-binding transcriptional regulator [Planctomycetota bacterium]
MGRRSSIAGESLSRPLLHHVAADRLAELIETNRLWGQCLPAERELARTLGISRGTLRKGLDLLEQEKIVARRHGQGTFVLKRSARDRAAAQPRVGIVSVTSSTPGGYFAAVTAGLTAGASDCDWNVTFFARARRPEKWRAFLDALDEREFDGLLLVSLTTRKMVEELLERWKGPTVHLDHYHPGLPVTSVIDDSRGGARLLTDHLLSLGHRRIAYVDVTDPGGNPWRHAGHVETMHAAGIEPDERLHVRCHAGLEDGYRAGSALLDLPEPPTAILAFEHTRAAGVRRAAEERGLRVGRDLALAAFSDPEPEGAGSPGLTCVRFDAQEMGVTAARELDDLIAGRTRPGRLVEVPVELIVRGSTGEALPAGGAPACRRRREL